MLGFLNINEIENILGFFRPKIGLTSPNGLLQWPIDKFRHFCWYTSTFTKNCLSILLEMSKMQETCLSGWGEKLQGEEIFEIMVFLGFLTTVRCYSIKCTAIRCKFHEILQIILKMLFKPFQEEIFKKKLSSFSKIRENLSFFFKIRELLSFFPKIRGNLSSFQFIWAIFRFY